MSQSPLKNGVSASPDIDLYEELLDAAVSIPSEKRGLCKLYKYTLQIGKLYKSQSPLKNGVSASSQITLYSTIIRLHCVSIPSEKRGLCKLN